MKPNKNQAVTQIQGLCAPMMIDDIDTDIIIPAQHLTQTSKSGYGQHAFARLKQNNPEFVLNQSAYQGAKILIAGDNFGCGSSREHAVWAIQELGFEAIIAPSFADIFSNNARKNGLVLIEQPINTCQLLADESMNSALIMTVDLINSQIKTPEITLGFSINSFFQHCITHGHSELGYLISHMDQIALHKTQSQNKQLFIHCPDQMGVTT